MAQAHIIIWSKAAVINHGWFRNMVIPLGYTVTKYDAHGGHTIIEPLQIRRP